MLHAASCRLPPPQQSASACRRPFFPPGPTSKDAAIDLSSIVPYLITSSLTLSPQAPRSGKGLGKSELNKVKRGGKGKHGFKSKAKHKRR